MLSVHCTEQVAELAARTGVVAPNLEAMTPEQVDGWLAITLASWIE